MPRTPKHLTRTLGIVLTASAIALWGLVVGIALAVDKNTTGEQ